MMPHGKNDRFRACELRSGRGWAHQSRNWPRWGDYNGCTGRRSQIGGLETVKVAPFKSTSRSATSPSRNARYRVGGCLSPEPAPAPSSTRPNAGIHRSCGACGRSLGEKTVAQTTKRARGSKHVQRDVTRGVTPAIPPMLRPLEHERERSQPPPGAPTRRNYINLRHRGYETHETERGIKRV